VCLYEIVQSFICEEDALAVVRAFSRTTQNAGLHPTEVECGYQVVHSAEGRLLQLSTYGSNDRQSPKKVSQTLQFDQAGAAMLLSIIRDAFPDLE